MITYEYKCVSCGNIMEVTFHNENIENFEKSGKCDICGSALKRKLSPFVTHFNYTRGKK
jgi:putative FmdB family regulatory protein